MGPIPVALSNIRFEIPEEVLTRTFLDTRRRYSVVAQDIDQVIRATVLEPRVLRDCNMIGGTEVLIDMSVLKRTLPDERSAVWDIPMEATQGRRIVSPQNVSYGYGYNYGTTAYNPLFDQTLQGGCGNAGILSTASTLWTANSNMPIVGTAKCTMIGVNQVLVQDQIRIPNKVWLRAMLTHDDELSNIQPASYEAFSQLCVYAVQAHIYRTMRVPLNMGEIAGGYELGSLKEIIMEYSDANELYKTYLKEVWRKVSRMNDHESSVRVIRQLMGNRG